MKPRPLVQAAAVAFAIILAVACSERKNHPVDAATYKNPEGAVSALVKALARNDAGALKTVLGSDSDRIVASGDPTADAAERKRFLEMYRQSNQLIERNGSFARLRVGSEGWTLPIPIVNAGKGWRFDTLLGAQEILSRRIGRNELAAILVCLAYVDAQREYARTPQQTSGLLEYAQRILSSPGKHDGLYWPAAQGEPASPMGPLVAAAQLEGYRQRSDGAPAPYHGYYYRILKGQGPNAAGGLYDYMVGSHMIGGFALIAYPAGYGASGVMTFIVNHVGTVLQRDFGPHTQEQAANIEQFDPDASWSAVAAQYTEAF